MFRGQASGRQSPLIFAANKPPVLEALLKAGAVLPPHDRRSPFLPADKSEEKLLLAAVQQVDRIRAGETLSSVSESESGVKDCDKDYGQELLAAPPHIRVTSSDDGGFGKGMEGLRRRERGGGGETEGGQSGEENGGLQELGQGFVSLMINECERERDAEQEQQERARDTRPFTALLFA